MRCVARSLSYTLLSRSRGKKVLPEELHGYLSIPDHGWSDADQDETGYIAMCLRCAKSIAMGRVCNAPAHRACDSCASNNKPGCNSVGRVSVRLLRRGFALLTSPYTDSAASLQQGDSCPASKRRMRRNVEGDHGRPPNELRGGRARPGGG